MLLVVMIEIEVVSAFELNNALTAEEFLFNSDDKFIVIKIRPETNQEEEIMRQLDLVGF